MWVSRLHHPSHPAHAAHSSHTFKHWIKMRSSMILIPTSHPTAGHGWLLLGDLGDDALQQQESREEHVGISRAHLSSAEKGGNSSSISQSSPHHLGGVNDTSSDHVDHLLVGSVKSLVDVPALRHLVDDHGGVQTGVVRDGVEGSGEGVLHDGDALLLILVLGN